MSKILYLGPPSPLVNWLRGQGEWVGQWSHKLGLGAHWPGLPRGAPPICAECDWLISYGYQHIVSQEILDLFPGRAINLHISKLPWGRGIDPNLWSWVEDTSKGVTIHRMDAGIDTGPILASYQWTPTDRAYREHTLRTSYDFLKERLEWLFRKHWAAIKAGEITPRAQPVGGSFHTRADRASVQHLLEPLDWDTPVSVLDSYAAETQMSEASTEKERAEILREKEKV